MKNVIWKMKISQISKKMKTQECVQSYTVVMAEPRFKQSCLISKPRNLANVCDIWF